MVKKTLVAGISIALAMALSACGKKDTPQTAEQAKADTEAAAKKREEAVGTADDKLKSGY